MPEEIEGLAGFVVHLVRQLGVHPADIIVMCPRRRIGYQIRNAIRAAEIDARSLFNEEALEEVEAQEAFALFTLFCNAEDRPALRFWLGYGSDNCRRGQYERLRGHCEATGDSPSTALNKLVSGELRLMGVSRLVARFRALSDALAGLQGLTNAELLDVLFPPGERWAEAMRDIVGGTDLEELAGPNDLLQLLRDYLTKPEIPAEPDFVRVMSLHASKGLTSRVVIVAGIIESLIPRAEREEDSPDERMRYLHEQRRLFYVAVTRPSERLVLSSPAHIDTADALAMGARVARDGQTSPSRFITELGLPGAALRGSDWRRADYRSPG